MPNKSATEPCPAACSRRAFLASATAMAASSLSTLATPDSAQARDPVGLGFNLIAWDNAANDDPRLWEQAVRDIRAIGAKRITVVPFWFVDPETAEVYERSRFGLERGPSCPVVAQAMRAARELEMEVSLKPLIEIDGADGTGAVWRGEINFSKRKLARFFDAYRAYIAGMTRLAIDCGAARVYVGSELAELTENQSALPHWKMLIQDIRSLYGRDKGRLSYASNYDEFEQVPFWADLDDIGIDAYFPLATEAQAQGPGRPSIEVMANSWLRHFESVRSFSQKTGIPVIFSEFGIVARDLASTQPWNWRPIAGSRRSRRAGQSDIVEQVNAVRALLQAAEDQGSWLRGIDFWHWKIPGSEGSLYNIDAGSALGEVIREFLAHGN